MICKVNGIEPPWMLAPIAVLEGIVHGYRMVVYRRGANADASWPKWAIIAASIVLLLPMSLVSFADLLLRGLFDAVEMARGRRRTFRPMRQLDLQPQVQEEMPMPVQIPARFRSVAPLAIQVEAQLSSPANQDILEKESLAVKLSKEPAFSTGLINDDITKEIFSFLTLKEGLSQSTTCKQFAGLVDQLVTGKMIQSGYVSKEIMRGIVSIGDRIRIKGGYVLFQEFLSQEDRVSQELFVEMQHLYPTKSILLTKSSALSSYADSATALTFAKRQIEVFAIKEVQHLMRLYQVDFPFYASVCRKLTLEDFGDSSIVSLVSAYGAIGFAFRGQVYRWGSPESLEAGILVVSKCVGDTDRHYVHIQREGKDLIDFFCSRNILHPMQLFKLCVGMSVGLGKDSRYNESWRFRLEGAHTSSSD